MLNPFDVLDVKLSQVQSLIEELMRERKEAPLQLIDEPEYLTREQVAKMFAVSTVTIWDWSNRGILKPYKISNKVRFLKSEVLSSPKAIKPKDKEVRHA